MGYEKIIGLLILLGLFSNNSFGQSKRIDSVYAFNYWIDVPVTLGTHAFNLWGQQYLFDLPTLTEKDYGHLTPEDVNPFDRIATRQDPAFADRAHELSDYGLRIAPAIPLVFMISDRRLRSNFLNIGLMYLETHGINAALYLAATIPIRRNRPFVYNPEEGNERKEEKKSTDSFFSGHVSTVTASTFFIVKVLSDYHPHLRKHWWKLYGLASIPSIYTGYFRMKAGKHFPTDLIVGYVVGAVAGIGVPQIHKSKWFHKIALAPGIRHGTPVMHMALKF